MPMRVEHSAFIQNPAPTFANKTAVVNGLFEQVSLDQYKGKWVVLAFIPMAFTFVCPTEIVAFSDKIQEFKDRNTEVLFASTDSEYTLLAWSNTARKDGGLGKVNLPLISDANHKLSYEYGVILPDHGISLRGLFIIDPKGILRQITINDLPVGRSVEETLRLLDAFQFTDKHGEVCPANWQKGAQTIDTSNASKYFQSQHK